MQTLSPLPVAPHVATAARAVQGSYVLLRADSLRLLLPQSDIHSTDYMQARPEQIEGDSGLLHVPAPVGLGVVLRMRMLGGDAAAVIA